MEKKRVAVRLEGAPLAEVVAERQAVKQALGVMLQIALDDPEPGAVVVASVARQAEKGVAVAVRDAGRGLSLEDVPPELLALTPALRSCVGDGSGLSGAGGEVSSSPRAVRLSLAASLSRLVGARFSLDGGPARGETMAMTFRPGALSAPARRARAA